MTSHLPQPRAAGRACFLLHVRPERLPDYIEAHRHVWDEMLSALSAAGWRNYSLFLRESDGLVVGYFESDDCAAAMQAMAQTDIDARWQAEMAAYFVQPDGGEPELLTPYFHLA